MTDSARNTQETAKIVAEYQRLITDTAGAVSGHGPDTLRWIRIAPENSTDWMNISGIFGQNCWFAFHKDAPKNLQINIEGSKKGNSVDDVFVILGDVKGKVSLAVPGRGASIVIGDCGRPFNLVLRAATRSRVVIGDGTTIGGANIMAARGSLVIGRDCLLSREISLISALDHGVLDLGGETPRFVPNKSDMIVGDHVWLGYNSHLVGGATIGDGAILAAHSVLAGKLDHNCVAVGNPATIKKRNTTWSRYAEKLDDETVAYLARLNSSVTEMTISRQVDELKG